MGYTLITPTQSNPPPPQASAPQAPPRKGGYTLISPAPQPNTAVDAAESGATGVMEGVTSLLGSLGDLQNAGDEAMSWVAQKLGVPKATVMRMAQAAKATRVMNFPSTDQIEGGLKSVGVPFHEPQTTAGKYARTIGQFAPAAVGSPGGLVRKTAMAVLPGVASEAAGQAADGTPLEPVARAVGALAGGIPSAGMGIRTGTKQMLKQAPTGAQLKADTNNLYGQLRAKGVKYDPLGYETMVNDLVSELKSDGFRRAQAPKGFDAIDAMIDHVGKSPDFNDFDSLRKTAGRLSKSPDPTERAVGAKITQHMDDFQNTPGSFMATTGGTSTDVNSLIGQARSTAQRNIKARLLETAVKKAQNYSYGADYGLRRQFQRLLDSADAARFTPEERKAIEAVAQGGPVQKIASILGRFGIDLGKGSNLQGMLPGAVLGLSTNWVTGGAGVIGASAAKFASRKMREAAAQRALATVRSGKQGQQQARALNSIEKRKALLRGALVGEDARTAVTSNPIDQQNRGDGQQPSYTAPYARVN